MNKLKSLINQKSKELKSIDEELPKKLESLIELSEINDNDKLIKENKDYKLQITEKNKEITDLKNKLKTISEDKDSINKDNKENKEEKENNNDNKSDISKDQVEKVGERKNTRKKTKRKKKNKKEEDEEIEEKKDENNIEKKNSDIEKDLAGEKKEDKEKNENNINDENKKEKEINYKEEYLKLKNLINDYEQGIIISEKTKNDMDQLKTESLTQIKELRSKINELNSSNLSKLKEYEILITNANIELSEKNKTIEEYESIALKQEDQIDSLNKRIYELNKTIFHKNLSMKENETYSNQLINIINENKLEIKKLKEQKQEEENEEIALLKKENINLKNEIELDKKLLQNMKLNHRSLQDKYLTMCYKVKKSEQGDLLKQADFLNKESLNKRINKNNNLKILTLNKSGSTGSLVSKKLRITKNVNKFNNKKFKNEELNLPEISLGNKSLENGHINKRLLFKEGKKFNFDNDYSKNLDEINDKLKKIIDDN